MKHPLVPFGIVLAAFFLGAAVIFYWSPPEMKKTVTLEIRGNPIAAEIAETIFERSRGLSGRQSIGSGEGMLFLFDTVEPHAMWMKDMEFPIDILWIKNSIVVDIEESARPEPGIPDASLTRYGPDGAAELVLELPAGFAKMHGILIGDEVTLRSGELPQKYRALLEK